MSAEKTYIAIDLKSFYASVECVERGLDPLKALLVVADVSRTEKTICLAVTPALKAYGISGRARLFEVNQRVKQVKAETGVELNYIAAVPRMALYIKYSRMINQIYLKYFASEDIHVYSVDEVFIDVTGYLKLYKMDAETLCRTVIQDVLTTTGITATAGIAPNLFLCKVAMDIVAKHKDADANGVRIATLDMMTFRRTLWTHTPITDFWRIGQGTEKRLARYGMYTLGDVARRSLSQSGERELYKLFGKDAEILIDHAWGWETVSIKDIKAYKSHASSLSSGQVLMRPYQTAEARLILKEMCNTLAMEMVEKKILASSFSLYVGYEAMKRGDDFAAVEGAPVGLDWYGRVVPMPSGGTVNVGRPTQLISRITSAYVYLFDAVVNPAFMIRRINLCANNVVGTDEVQYELFDDNEGICREENLQNAVLGIQKRYGKNAMLKAMNYEECAMTIKRNQQIGGHRA